MDEPESKNTCPSCSTANPPKRVRCVRCGTKLPDLKAQAELREQEPGFQAVGSVELKKSKTGLAGILSWKKKPKGATNGQQPEQAATLESNDPGVREEEPLVDGFQASVWDQIDDIKDPDTTQDNGHLPGEEAAPKAVDDAPRLERGVEEVLEPPGDVAHEVPSRGVVSHGLSAQSVAAPVSPHDYSSQNVTLDRNTVLIGAPPLLQLPVVAPAIEAAPRDGTGLLATLAYGMKAPKIAQRQQERVRALSSQVSKLKKKEQELVAALGRAAFVHKLTTDGSDPSQEEQSEQLSHEESRLVDLGHQYENMTAHLEVAQRTLTQGEQQLAQLRQRELELRSPPQSGISEAEAAQRVNEYESVKAARTKAEQDFEKLQEKVTASRQPMQRIKSEIDQLRQDIQSANQRKMENRSKAARSRSGENGGAKASDVELGQGLLDNGGVAPQLRQLVVSIDTNNRRTARLSDSLERQQGELNLFDEKRARSGFWMLIGAILGGLILVLGSGEILRRILLSLGD